MTQTVFGIQKTHGEFDGDYIWRYVPNERIDFLKLEKIVFDRTPINNKSRIADNKEQIEELQNGTKE